MNKIKFRPVGRPSAAAVIVKVSQAKRAIYGIARADGRGYHPAAGISKAMAEKGMLRKGYLRSGSRA